MVIATSMAAAQVSSAHPQGGRRVLPAGDACGTEEPVRVKVVCPDGDDVALSDCERCAVDGVGCWAVDVRLTGGIRSCGPSGNSDHNRLTPVWWPSPAYAEGASAGVAMRSAIRMTAVRRANGRTTIGLAGLIPSLSQPKQLATRGLILPPSWKYMG
jgi:hypothetical protein